MEPARFTRSVPLWPSRLGAVAACVFAMGTAPVPEAPLRVGLAHLPPESTTPEARLYTDEGLERDLARELAKVLGRRVDFIEVADGAGAVERGEIDLALARLPEGADPSGSAIIDTGYRSGLRLSMRSDTDIRVWDDLAGRTVCLTEGNPAAETLAREHGAVIRAERAPARSLMLVRTGVCDAALHDAALLEALFENDGWRKFSASPSAAAETRLVALTAPERASEISAAMADLGAPDAWERRERRWARNVAFEVYLDQDAPDCH